MQNNPPHTAPKTTTCDDCMGMVSRSAKVCPHCGKRIPPPKWILMARPLILAACPVCLIFLAAMDMPVFILPALFFFAVLYGATYIRNPY